MDIHHLSHLICYEIILVRRPNKKCVIFHTKVFVFALFLSGVIQGSSSSEIPNRFEKALLNFFLEAEIFTLDAKQKQLA